jgi:hypothetical protein
MCEIDVFVKSGKSEVFKNWQKFAAITEEDFISGITWLWEDPARKSGTMTRELGCDVKRGIVRLRRITDKSGLVSFYDEGGDLWTSWAEAGGADQRTSLSPRDRL